MRRLLRKLLRRLLGELMRRLLGRLIKRLLTKPIKSLLRRLMKRLLRRLMKRLLKRLMKRLLKKLVKRLRRLKWRPTNAVLMVVMETVAMVTGAVVEWDVVMTKVFATAVRNRTLVCVWGRFGGFFLVLGG